MLLTPELWRIGSAILLIALWLLLTLWAWRRQQPDRAPPANPDRPPIPVVFASQSGQAEAIARDTVARLAARQQAAVLRRIEQDWLDDARRAGQAYFIVSTWGAGTSPAHAESFVQGMGRTAPGALAGVRYRLLALGDRHYPDFCAFGRQLDAWLQHAGAQADAPRIEADALAPEALQAWHDAPDAGSASPQPARPAATASAARPVAELWQLQAREHLNPGSPGQPLCRITLTPTAPGAQAWQAGDLVDIFPPGPPAAPRSYSIANLPGSGGLELIVRTCLRASGEPGLVSGWLNGGLPPGGTLRLRLRPNPAFHLPALADGPLLLIGTGAGLAGLLGHLRAREQALAASGQAAPARCVWLVYGERHPEHDRPCAAEFRHWQESGLLSRLDLCFSRSAEPRYVQHALQANAGALRDWIGAGATVLVCGSATRMARDVDAALTGILGADTLAALAREGRLKRDVF